jgi:raffinose/stachyose/melibiose transport system permease protein
MDNRQAALFYLPLIVLMAYALGPMLILFFNSLKTTAEIFSNPFLPTSEPQWANYTEAFRAGRFGQTLLISILLVAGVVPTVLLVSFPAAYVLAREKPAGSDVCVLFLLVVSTFPPQLYLVPMFVFLSQNGLLNNLFVLGVIYVAKFSPFAVFILRAFLLRVPEDLDDAAYLDGASTWRMMTTILAPICKPVLITVAVITALNVWNEFVLAVTFIQDANLKPISTSLFAFRSQYSTDWPLTNAGAVISALLPIVVFMALQRRFIEGLTSGSVK